MQVRKAWLYQRFLSAGLLIPLVFTSCAPSPPSPSDGGLSPVHLRFATFTQGTAWYAYGASIAELLRPQLPSGSSLDVLPLAGGVANPQLLAQGKADFALNFAVNVQWARQGRIIYEEKME
ncbi:MAG: hypothetical protein O6826_05535, partial [Acidobacteria bacterium]|nr:hypothetical protein [Acidobacteriota bacterium]